MHAPTHICLHIQPHNTHQSKEYHLFWTSSSCFLSSSSMTFSSSCVKQWLASCFWSIICCHDSSLTYESTDVTTQEKRTHDSLYASGGWEAIAINMHYNSCFLCSAWSSDYILVDCNSKAFHYYDIFLLLCLVCEFDPTIHPQKKKTFVNTTWNQLDIPKSSVLGFYLLSVYTFNNNNNKSVFQEG